MYSLENEVNGLIKSPDIGRSIGIIKLQMVREHGCLYGGQKASDIGSAVGMARPLFAFADREMMAVMSVSSALEPLAIEVVAVGGLDTCCVDMKNLFKHAILSNAGKIICFHNHPSGIPSPSKADYDITERIRKSGEILGIELLDHIIVGTEGYYSFAGSGAFPYK